MMSDNKSLLNIHCQKKGISTPTYKTRRIGGDDHNPLWISIVTIQDGDNIKQFIGMPSKSKKLAEFSSAKQATQELSKEINNENVNVDVNVNVDINTNVDINQKIGIFIDIENKHNMVQDLIHKLKTETNFTGAKHTDIDIYAFASEDHPSFLKLQKQDISPVHLLEVPSRRKDGADIGLILTVGGFLFAKKYNNYIIITSDHFGDTLCEIINNWCSNSTHFVKAYCCHTLDKVLQILD